MIYFDALSDLKHMELLLLKFEEIIDIEQEVRDILRNQNEIALNIISYFREIREYSKGINPKYNDLRAEYAQMIPRANSICEKENIIINRSGNAAPIEGGAAFRGSILELVLNRPSDILDINTDLRDTVNRTIGSLKNRIDREKLQLINPIYWFRKLIIFIIQLPYTILKLSGFDVNKIQDHFLARIAQLFYVIALILIFTYFGLSSLIDLGSFIKILF